MKIVGKLLDGRNLVGYVVSNGQEVKNLTVEQVVQLVKDKKIENVKYLSNRGTITGCNGFELKKLPSKQLKEKVNSKEDTNKLEAYKLKLKELKIRYNNLELSNSVAASTIGILLNNLNKSGLNVINVASAKELDNLISSLEKEKRIKDMPNRVVVNKDVSLLNTTSKINLTNYLNNIVDVITNSNVNYNTKVENILSESNCYIVLNKIHLHMDNCDMYPDDMSLLCNYTSMVWSMYFKDEKAAQKVNAYLYKSDSNGCIYEQLPDPEYNPEKYKEFKIERMLVSDFNFILGEGDVGEMIKDLNIPIIISKDLEIRLTPTLSLIKSNGLPSDFDFTKKYNLKSITEDIDKLGHITFSVAEAGNYLLDKKEFDTYCNLTYRDYFGKNHIRECNLSYAGLIYTLLKYTEKSRIYWSDKSKEELEKVFRG